ncbi:MAG: HNH endonuclease [Pseudomonadota bacterium]
MFTPGLRIKRSVIHDKYGGSRRSGISPSAKFPYIFIFTGASGSTYGYEDQWLTKDVFQYTGEGQNGDMEFVRGNLAIRNHIKGQKQVFLFESADKGHVHFVAEVTVFDVDYFEGVDVNGRSRRGIKFFFSRADQRVSHVDPAMDYFTAEIKDPRKPTQTERSGLVTSRVGQGAYRKSLIYRWGNRCAVTRYENQKVLIASHIVPWKEASDTERLDVNNGLLLSPTYDALFDKNLISFGDEGEILLSQEIRLSSHHRIGVTGQEQIVGLSASKLKYLSRH